VGTICHDPRLPALNTSGEDKNCSTVAVSALQGKNKQNIEILPMVSPSVDVREKATLSEAPGRLIIASDQQPEACSRSPRSSQWITESQNN